MNVFGPSDDPCGIPMCLCVVRIFGVVIPFSSYWPPKFTEATEKSVFFREKRSLSGKFSKFRYERIHHGFTYSCQVSRKSVKQKWPNGCVVFITKKGGTFAPLSKASGAMLRKVLYYYYDLLRTRQQTTCTIKCSTTKTHSNVKHKRLVTLKKYKSTKNTSTHSTCQNIEFQNIVGNLYSAMSCKHLYCATSLLRVDKVFPEQFLQI